MPWLQYAVRSLRPCHHARLERCSGGLRWRLRRLPASRPGHRSLDNARKCTPAFLLPIDACRTSSSILGGGALVVTFGLTSSGAGTQSTAVAKTVSPDRVNGFFAIGAHGKVTAYSGKWILSPACLPPSHRSWPKSCADERCRGHPRRYGTHAGLGYDLGKSFDSTAECSCECAKLECRAPVPELLIQRRGAAVVRGCLRTSLISCPGYGETGTNFVTHSEAVTSRSRRSARADRGDQGALR